jgi:hypothetical protein
MNRKGGALDLTLVIIIFFVFVVAGGILWFVISYLNSAFSSEPSLHGFTAPIGYSSQTLNMLNLGAIVAFVGMIIALFCSSYFIPSHKISFVINLLIILIVALIAAMISNAYYTLTQDPVLGTYYLTKFPMPTYIIFNLPYIFTIIGLFDAVIMAIKVSNPYSVSSGGGLPGA